MTNRSPLGILVLTPVIMISELFSSLAAPVFAAMLFLFFLKSRSREINGGEANNDAAANEGTAGGASGAHTPTGAPEMATSSGPAKDAAANDGTAGGDSGAHTSTGYDYEVFLSFRGPDTRETFTDHLYTSLKTAGIRAFKDDEDLRVGEEFAPELLQAIKQSKILVPIFSKDYATSVWCLKEVVQMVKSKKTGGQKIVPIFYDVAPSKVRHQTGGYKDAFILHDSKKRYDQNTIGEWKAALSAVGEINGYDLQSMPNRREGEFVKKFTQEVFIELKKASLAESEYLVHVDNHVDAIMEKIGDGTSETRIIGIHGMGGIGKTTIAKIIFNKFADDFENCCFLRDIRETSKTSGIQCLQKQLISSILKMECTDIKDVHEGTRTIKNRLSNKRVLFLLDDIDEADHIDALVCKRDWLGEGSKIIITSRRIDVLYVREVDWRYELTGMDLNQSLQLFSKHAFRRDSPLDEYISQSNRAIKIAGGLPLAIEVIGSLLARTEKEKWDRILNKLANVLDAKVQRRLKISYDALEVREKHIFLDIACLFIGYDKDILVLFWDESNFFSKEAMEVLQNMSLIKITKDNKVWMHDHLRDLGREVVHKKSDMEIKKQNRVWDPKVGSDLLWKHKGKKEVQALRLNFDHEDRHCFTYEGFENLSHLRFLEVVGLRTKFHAEERLLCHESLPNVLPINLNSDLLPHLRWLSWSDFPPTFNIANFFMEDVVILNLSKSEITDDWKGWSHMKVMKNLKILNLSNCQNLKRLPDELGRYLASLEYLSLNSCELLERLPDSIGNLESLIELDISTTGIEELPNSIGKLKKLKKLEMWNSHIRKIPDALWTIEKFEEIEVSTYIYGQSFHVNIGNCICKNQFLRILILDIVDIIALPKLPESLVILRLDSLKMDTFPDLSNLINLKELHLWFRSCGEEYGELDRESDGPLRENSIPQWIGNLSKLESLDLGCPYVTTSPIDLTLPPNLKSLFLKCPNLRRLPRLPSSLSCLWLSECKSLFSMEDLSNLKKLLSLCIEDSAIEEIQGLGCLDNLGYLELESLGQVKILSDLRNLNKLRILLVSHCVNLVEIQGELPRFLDQLRISSCGSLQNLPDLSSLMGKQNVQISYCSELNMEAILGFAQINPRYLQFLGFGQLRILPDLSNSSELRHLEVRHCHNLIEIQGELPKSLEVLAIDSCESLQKLPDLSSLKELQKLIIKGCNELKGEAILGSTRRSQENLWENLQYLKICGLVQMEILLDLSNLNKLRRLLVSECVDLVEIQDELPQSLEVLAIDSCESLLKLPDLSSLKELQVVSIKGCKELKGEAILGSPWRIQANLWENLQYLRICGLEQMEILPDLSNLSKLKCLKVQSCDNLDEIQGELPESLKVLEISSCINIQKLPDLTGLNGLQKVKIYHCFGLNVEAISLLCSEKSTIFVREDGWVEVDTWFEYKIWSWI